MNSHQQPQHPDHGAILRSVGAYLWNAGFDCKQLTLDTPTTPLGGYRFESYLCGLGNLALLEIPPGHSTEANLFKGPPGINRSDFSFTVHSFAGDGVLLLTRPGSYDVEVIKLWRGAPAHHVRPGDIYAYRAGPRGLIVGDYCKAVFQRDWEEAIESGTPSHDGLALPARLWQELHPQATPQEDRRTEDCSEQS